MIYEEEIQTLLETSLRLVCVDLLSMTLPCVYSSKGNTKCKVLVTSFHLNWLELVQNHS